MTPEEAFENAAGFSPLILGNTINILITSLITFAIMLFMIKQYKKTNNGSPIIKAIWLSTSLVVMGIVLIHFIKQ